MAIVNIKNTAGDWEEMPALQGNPDDFISLVYPVGSIYMSVNDVSPSTLFGGTWEKIEDTFLLASGSAFTLGQTGGEANHTLTINEIPSHQHSVPFGATTAGDSSGFPYAWESRLTSATQGKGWGANAGTFAQGKSQPHNNMPLYLVVNI